MDTSPRSWLDGVTYNGEDEQLHTGIFPDKLKLAKVIPVFKKGDRTKLDSYRPISILSVIYKTFEKKTYSINSTNTLLTTIYFIKANMGLKNKSTELAVIELINVSNNSISR